MTYENDIFVVREEYMSLSAETLNNKSAVLIEEMKRASANQQDISNTTSLGNITFGFDI